MATHNKSRFRDAAVTSGLVSADEIDEAIAALRDAAKTRGATTLQVDDRGLATKLVELGALNSWQADELLKGRVKWTLGPYRIVDSIGQGGMGQVFKAEHTIMRRIVAIKVLPRQKSTPESIQNFQREIQAQAQLDHHNLVRAYDAGNDGNVHYLVTEYVPGVDLRKLIRRRGRFGMAASAAIICQAARGLEHAHSRELIHRDVKPGNLLVTPEGLCKVSDLGLAGFLREEDDSRRKKTVGTADYLSPEQIMTPEELTTTSDIYSLGCTLYYAVTGKVPFPGGTTRDKARSHCNDQPIDPRRLNPELETEFVDVIADMMVKKADERLQTAGEVIERLQAWAGDDWEAAVAAELNLAAPSRGRPHNPPPPPADMSVLDADTKPIEDMPDWPDRDSPSQVSQTTFPMASADEETHTFDSHSHSQMLPPLGEPSTLATVAMWLSVAAAVAVLGLIAWIAFF